MACDSFPFGLAAKNGLVSTPEWYQRQLRSYNPLESLPSPQRKRFNSVLFSAVRSAISLLLRPGILAIKSQTWFFWDSIRLDLWIGRLTGKAVGSFLDTVTKGLPFPEIYIADGDVDLETGEGTQLLVDGLQ